MRQTFKPSLPTILYGLIALMTGVLFAACSSSGNYAYPTEVTQEVNYVCSKVFDAPFRAEIGASHQSAISKVMAFDGEILAYFSDGNRVTLPLSNSLPEGEEFYCGTQQNQHYPCLAGENLDSNCTRRSPHRISE